MNGMERRDFLRGSAMVAAGAAVLPSVVRCNEVKWEAYKGKTAPIRMGIIGMGKQCIGHLNHLVHRDDVRVMALCDVESIRLNKSKEIADNAYKRIFGSSARPVDIYEDFRDILKRSDIDAVLISTQTHWHAAMSVMSAQAGKDVYCEKPMTLSIHEGRAIVNAVKRYGIVYQNGSQQRSDGKFRLACELVRNGKIGKVKTIFINNVGDPSGPCYLPAEPTPPTLNWDLWLGPAPYRPYNKILCPLDDWKVFPAWRSYSDYDGGGMTDWGAHHFDIGQWALDMDDSGPVQIVPPRESEFGRLTYVYANGTKMVRGGAKPSEAGLEIIGETGRICVNRGYLMTEPDDLIRTKWGADDIRLYESSTHWNNFLDCVRERRECVCTAEIGHRSSTVCHLGIICYRLDRTLNWDPVKERFVNDPEADRLIHKPTRAPWIV
jgi:predicted dehydrogenase